MEHHNVSLINVFDDKELIRLYISTLPRQGEYITFGEDTYRVIKIHYFWQEPYGTVERVNITVIKEVDENE